MVNKLTEIVSEYNSACRKANELVKSIHDDEGLYKSLNLLLDLYIDNNPVPTIYKPNIIDNFFEDLSTAYKKIQYDYKMSDDVKKVYQK